MRRPVDTRPYVISDHSAASVAEALSGISSQILYYAARHDRPFFFLFFIFFTILRHNTQLAGEAAKDTEGEMEETVELMSWFGSLCCEESLQRKTKKIYIYEYERNPGTKQMALAVRDEFDDAFTEQCNKKNIKVFRFNKSARTDF